MAGRGEHLKTESFLSVADASQLLEWQWDYNEV